MHAPLNLILARRLHPTRTNRIDPDPVPHQRKRRIFRQRQQRPLRRAIRRQKRLPTMRRHRQHIDNRAGLPATRCIVATPCIRKNGARVLIANIRSNSSGDRIDNRPTIRDRRRIDKNIASLERRLMTGNDPVDDRQISQITGDKPRLRPSASRSRLTALPAPDSAPQSSPRKPARNHHPRHRLAKPLAGSRNDRRHPVKPRQRRSCRPQNHVMLQLLAACNVSNDLGKHIARPPVNTWPTQKSGLA